MASCLVSTSRDQGIQPVPTVVQVDSYTIFLPKPKVTGGVWVTQFRRSRRAVAQGGSRRPTCPKGRRKGSRTRRDLLNRHETRVPDALPSGPSDKYPVLQVRTLRVRSPRIRQFTRGVSRRESDSISFYDRPLTQFLVPLVHS